MTKKSSRAHPWVSVVDFDESSLDADHHVDEGSALEGSLSSFAGHSAIILVAFGWEA